MESRKIVLVAIVALALFAGYVIARNDLIVGSIRVDSVLVFQ